MNRTLGRFEEIVLREILNNGDKAYGVPIRQGVSEVMGREIAIGAIYTSLERLEAKGFVRSWLGDPSKERGGRAKRYYRVEAAGEQALHEVERLGGRVNARFIPLPSGGGL